MKTIKEFATKYSQNAKLLLYGIVLENGKLTSIDKHLKQREK